MPPTLERAALLPSAAESKQGAMKIATCIDGIPPKGWTTAQFLDWPKDRRGSDSDTGPVDDSIDCSEPPPFKSREREPCYYRRGLLSIVTVSSSQRYTALLPPPPPKKTKDSRM